MDYTDRGDALVGNHAPFTWGEDVSKAVYNSAVCEEVAKTGLPHLADKSQLQPLKEALKKKHFDRKHGKDAYYGQGC